MKHFEQLVISPHADDEVYGCGGIIGKKTFVYYCGVDETLIAPDPVHRVPLKHREREIKKAAAVLGFQWECNYKTKVLHFKENELIPEIERIINRIRPDKVFIPFPSYNQDHRTVYQACRVALRPHDKNFFVKKVLVYEQDQSIVWETNPLNPNYFVPIDINRKIRAYRAYASQMRGMRPADLLRAVARLRGAQVNCQYAEAFRIERWVP